MGWDAVQPQGLCGSLTETTCRGLSAFRLTAAGFTRRGSFRIESRSGIKSRISRPSSIFRTVTIWLIKETKSLSGIVPGTV